jgi:hypothetical protein
VTAEAEALLACARELLAAPEPAAVGRSARLAAFLARQAVEDLIDARCARVCGVQVADATTKAKLAVLKSLDASAAGAVLLGAWHQLTGFCHQHAYQLSPTVAEVRQECRAVERVCLAGDPEADGADRAV